MGSPRKGLDLNRSDRYFQITFGIDRRMSKALQRVMSVGLVICLLLLGSVASVQAIEHAVHHEHHQAGAHATILCSWMCAAGQGVESSAVGPQPQAMLPQLIEPLLCQKPIDQYLAALPSRGPPSFSA